MSLSMISDAASSARRHPTRLVQAARSVLARARRGAFATRSADGSPLGSLLRFACRDLSPLVALPPTSGHAENLAQDLRASLLVADPECATAPDRGIRVTLVGRACLESGHAAEAARSALEAPAEHLIYRIEVESIRVASSDGSVELTLDGTTTEPGR